MPKREKWICIAHNYMDTSFSSMSYHLAHFLAQNGSNILFISHKPRIDHPLCLDKYNGKIHVYSWPAEKRPTDIKSFIWFAGIYFKYRPSTVVAHFAGENVVSIVSKVFSFWRTRVFVYYHTLNCQIELDNRKQIKLSFLKMRKRIFYRLFTDRTICPSSLAKEDFIKTFAKKKSDRSCIVIHNPIPDRYTYKSQVRSSDKIIISYLGRLDPSKGVSELLKAFIKYNKQTETKIQLRIAGMGVLFNQVTDFLKENATIKYFGAIPYNEVDEYIQSSDYIIVPSLCDNLPTVALESLMNGVPVLLSTRTGLSDLLKDGEVGFIFSPTESGFLEVFERVEKSNYDSFLFSQNARKIYVEQFSLKNYFINMMHLLED